MPMHKRLLAAIFSAILICTGSLPGWTISDNHYDLHFHAGPESAAAAQQYTCSMHPTIIRDEPGNCPICGMTLTPVKAEAPATPEKPPADRKIRYWVAPMDPTYIRNQPGKSPMGMDLVPVYEDQLTSGVITIDPATRQDMGVRTAPVTRSDLHRAIRTVGLVGYEEPKQYSVNSKIEGWVEKLMVNQTGESVRQGQPMLSIYSPELVTAQEEFLLALRNRKVLTSSNVPEISNGAENLLEASRQRLRYWDISEAQIEELEKNGRTQKTMILHAPYDGVVTMKKVNQGMYVKAGMELFQISDISRVWIYADIYEYELAWVKVGQKASIELPYRSEPIGGKLSMIYPYVESKTRTVKARIDLDNPGLALKPDMYVNVSLEAQTVKNVLVIPAEAVIDSGKSQTVFVALGDGRFEPRQVKLGLRGDDGLVEIKQGLLPGESVVTSAQFMLDSESTLRAAIRKMVEPPKSSSKSTAPAPAGAGQNRADEKLEDLFK